MGILESMFAVFGRKELEMDDLRNYDNHTTLGGYGLRATADKMQAQQRNAYLEMQLHNPYAMTPMTTVEAVGNGYIVRNGNNVRVFADKAGVASHLLKVLVDPERDLPEVEPVEAGLFDEMEGPKHD